MKFFRQCCAAFLLLIVPLCAMAEEPIPPSPIAKTELLIDAKDPKNIWAAVAFTMPEHWHIYWQNPGDSGIPTTYSWTLPEGTTAGDIHWPAPERIAMSDIINFGYSNRVLLPVQLTSANTPADGTVTVKANWLVCRDICIPESATLTGSLSVVDAKAAEEIAAALKLEPKPAPVPITYQLVDKFIQLEGAVSGFTPPFGADAIVQWFPIEDGIIVNSAATHFTTKESSMEEASFTLQMDRGAGELLPEWHGVLSIQPDAKSPANYYQVTAKYFGELPAPTVVADMPDTLPATDHPAIAPVDFTTALILALLGGLILNIMPCVLPILALKALAIVKKAEVSRRSAAMQGFAYTIGVIGSFLAIAGLMLALKLSGNAIGWGFQLQNSGFVAFLTVVMLLVSANLLGLFSLPVLFGTHAHEVNENSRLGSILTGALAVLVATPCTAPFMATAIGTTLALPVWQALVVFAALGLGMASPFLLISLWPAALRLIPKPGAWMHRFKQILAIPMLATAAWLIWVLVQLQSPPMQADAHQQIYSAEKLAQLRDAGTPVLVDATAAWCLTCKVNERVAIRPLESFLAEKQVVWMVADWTNSDPAITQYLASFNRNGVPLVVYYPPHAEPIVLPQILSPSIIRNVVNR